MLSIRRVFSKRHLSKIDKMALFFLTYSNVSMSMIDRLVNLPSTTCIWSMSYFVKLATHLQLQWNNYSIAVALDFLNICWQLPVITNLAHKCPVLCICEIVFFILIETKQHLVEWKTEDVVNVPPCPFILLYVCPGGLLDELKTLCTPCMHFGGVASHFGIIIGTISGIASVHCIYLRWPITPPDYLKTKLWHLGRRSLVIIHVLRNCQSSDIGNLWH